MVRPRPPKPPTQDEQRAQIEDTLRWRRQYTGLDQEGVEERAKQIAATPPPPPRFTPAPPRR